MVERKFIVGRAIEKESDIQALLDKGWKISEMKICGKTTGDTTIAVYLVKDDEDDEPKTCSSGQFGPPPPQPIENGF
jgi:hypothetical protein